MLFERGFQVAALGFVRIVIFLDFLGANEDCHFSFLTFAFFVFCEEVVVVLGVLVIFLNVVDVTSFSAFSSA